MVFIKQKELEARHSVFDNPLKMKQIKEEIEALKAYAMGTNSPYLFFTIT